MSPATADGTPPENCCSEGADRHEGAPVRGAGTRRGQRRRRDHPRIPIAAEHQVGAATPRPAPRAVISTAPCSLALVCRLRPNQLDDDGGGGRWRPILLAVPEGTDQCHRKRTRSRGACIGSTTASQSVPTRDVSSRRRRPPSPSARSQSVGPARAADPRVAPSVLACASRARGSRTDAASCSRPSRLRVRATRARVSVAEVAPVPALAARGSAPACSASEHRWQPAVRNLNHKPGAAIRSEFELKRTNHSEYLAIPSLFSGIGRAQYHLGTDSRQLGPSPKTDTICLDTMLQASSGYGAAGHLASWPTRRGTDAYGGGG